MIFITQKTKHHHQRKPHKQTPNKLIDTKNRSVVTRGEGRGDAKKWAQEVERYRLPVTE